MLADPALTVEYELFPQCGQYTSGARGLIFGGAVTLTLAPPRTPPPMGGTTASGRGASVPPVAMGGVCCRSVGSTGTTPFAHGSRELDGTDRRPYGRLPDLPLAQFLPEPVGTGEGGVFRPLYGWLV